MSFEYVQLCGYHDHPNAHSNGVILEHRFVMSEYLGRPLEDDEIVHHCDKIRYHNDIENLELMLRTHHSRQHSSIGKTMFAFRCPECEKEFLLEKKQIHSIKTTVNKVPCCSRSCGAKYGHRMKNAAVAE